MVNLIIQLESLFLYRIVSHQLYHYNDFLDYVTKTIDVFSAMKFKDRLKCLFEQFIIIISIMVVLLIIGLFGSNILSNLLSFLPDKIYYSVYNIFEAIYIIAGLILGIILVLYIFKIRYLNYYVVVKENVSESMADSKKESSIDEIKEVKTVELEKPKQKIIIRDPEHSGYKFISGLLKCLLFFVKFIFGCIGIGFCFSLIVFIITFVISFAFVKTGIFFVGILLLIMACIILNIIVLIFIYNFIISRKNKKDKMAFAFLTSLAVLGIGIGFITLGVTHFDIVNDINSECFVSEEYTLEMADALFLRDYYGSINYVESDNKNIKIVSKHSKYYDVEMVKIKEGYYFYHNLEDVNVMELIRNCIDDINDKKIINYENSEIYVYTTKENIEKLKINLNNYWNTQEEISRQEMINEYERTINNLELKLERKNDEIQELMDNCIIETEE